RPNDVIETVGVGFVEKAGLLRTEMKFRRWPRTVRLEGAVRRVEIVTRRRQVAAWKAIGIAFDPMRAERTWLPPRREAQGACQLTDAPGELFVNAAELFAALQFVSGDSESGEHADQD